MSRVLAFVSCACAPCVMLLWCSACGLVSRGRRLARTDCGSLGAPARLPSWWDPGPRLGPLLSLWPGSRSFVQEGVKVLLYWAPRFGGGFRIMGSGGAAGVEVQGGCRRAAPGALLKRAMCQCDVYPRRGSPEGRCGQVRTVAPFCGGSRRSRNGEVPFVPHAN